MIHVKAFKYPNFIIGLCLLAIYYGSKDSINLVYNYAGGILGGISNGMDITFKVAFKPVATIMHNQQTINAAGEASEIKGKGRHDPCVVPRAVVIVEAMAALVLADQFLRNKVSIL